MWDGSLVPTTRYSQLPVFDPLPLRHALHNTIVTDRPAYTAQQSVFESARESTGCHGLAPFALPGVTHERGLAIAITHQSFAVTMILFADHASMHRYDQHGKATFMG
jgi:hypothetical protein